MCRQRHFRYVTRAGTLHDLLGLSFLWNKCLTENYSCRRLHPNHCPHTFRALVLSTPRRGSQKYAGRLFLSMCSPVHSARMVGIVVLERSHNCFFMSRVVSLVVALL